VCGLQRRYQDSYLQTLDKAREGMAGEILAAQVYWCSGGLWVRPRQPDMTEMEYQMRNWYYFNWICGDHIVEQHVHNLDVANWFKGAHPVKAVGMGGRAQRVGPETGEIFDHHYVEYQYPDGSIMNSQCRHWDDTWTRVSESLVGTSGVIQPGIIRDRSGKVLWRFRGPDNNPYQKEHDVLYQCIRENKPVNDAHFTAESTLTAIMGRMATYSGQEVTWEMALASELDTMPPVLSWDAAPGPRPGEDGLYPCPVPGRTRAI
jgi:myo-inositol 2-dehydrogenase / D-chiro-inositol 1-dehydrogenase